MMKRFSLAFVMGALLCAGCSISPSKVAIPFDGWFMQMGVGAQFIPATESWTLMRVSPLWFDDDRVCLLTVAGVSSARANSFVTLAGANFADSGVGVSMSALVDSCEDHVGVRVGAITCGGTQNGVQVGLFNSCSPDSHALQIGLINWNGYFPFPLVNVALGGEDEPEVETVETSSIVPREEPVDPYEPLVEAPEGTPEPAA